MDQSRSKTVWRIACIVVLIGGIVFTETHHKLQVFRLLTFIQVFVLLAIATSALHGRLQSALLVISTFAFGLVAIEAAGNWVITRKGAVATARDRVPAAAGPSPDQTRRASVAHPTARQDMVDANLFSPTPGVGWRLARAGNVHVVKIDPVTGETIYDVHYTIDGNLDRTTVSTDGGRAIAFLGDSFTFGSGVDDSQTMEQRLADLTGRKQRIVNLGVPGYSPAQVLYQLRNRTKAKVIGPKPIALIMLTGPYHASRIACKDTFTSHAPRFARYGGTIAHEGPCYEGIALAWRDFLDNCASYLAFVAPLTRRVTQADLDLYVDLVAEVSATAERMYGIKPLVPYVHFYETAHEAVLARLRDKGVDVIDMTFKKDTGTDPPTIIRGDGHPTPYAHDLRARMIKDALERRGVSFAGNADAP